MPGQSIPVGPFIGGLNTFSDPTSIADNELVVCENFELDLDGSLKSRPPFVDLEIDFPLDSTGDVTYLGYFYTAAGAAYLIASDGDSSTYYFDGSSWTLITDALSAAAFTQFDDKAWLTAAYGSAQTGGYWTPSGGFTTDSNMPKGDSIISFKERLWVAPGQTASSNGTKIYASQTIAAPSLWLATNDVIDTGSGDGQNVVALAVYFNTIIIFRTNSILGFQYSTDPAAGALSLVVPNVGLNSKDSITQFESAIYFMYQDKAYEFSNNRATQINPKVPFVAGTTSGIYVPYSVSEFNRRIIFSYYDNMYVYGLRTQTWTTWKSTVFGAIGKIVKRETASGTFVAVAHLASTVASGESRTAVTLQITDAVTNDAEEMTCKIRTKNFNYQAPAVYKRLFWWGVDATFRGEVTGTMYPVTYNFSVPWQTLLDNETWQTMLAYNWGQPQSEPGTAVTNLDVEAYNIGRKFVKFNKGLRFRQAYFTVDFATDGSTGKAPVRLFSLMTYVNPKQTVSTSIS